MIGPWELVAMALANTIDKPGLIKDTRPAD
jgi:hypothetical protein